MTAPTGPTTSSPAFERVQEYQAVLENVAHVSTRRQNTHHLFVSLNILFLTALGFLLISAHFNSWWLVAALGVITITIVPMNIIWRLSLGRYRHELRVKYQYIRDIEKEFQVRRGGTPGAPDGIGLFTRYHAIHVPGTGNTRLEISLANYCICLYPLITATIAVLTYLITYHYLPPFTISLP